jgi:hypothetical protein
MTTPVFPHVRTNARGYATTYRDARRLADWAGALYGAAHEVCFRERDRDYAVMRKGDSIPVGYRVVADEQLTAVP